MHFSNAKNFGIIQFFKNLIFSYPLVFFQRKSMCQSVSLNAQTADFAYNI